jgi:hypothetical protein
MQHSNTYDPHILQAIRCIRGNFLILVLVLFHIEALA